MCLFTRRDFGNIKVFLLSRFCIAPCKTRGRYAVRGFSTEVKRGQQRWLVLMLGGFYSSERIMGITPIGTDLLWKQDWILFRRWCGINEMYICPYPLSVF